MLHRHGMGIVMDIVPNHMAADAMENPWWRDVLARGRHSRYARFFDIDWSAPEPWLRGKVLLPVLGRPYAEALAAGEIRLERDAAGRAGEIVCFGRRLPVAAGTAAAGELSAVLDAQHYRLAWWRTAGDAINWRRFFNVNDLVALRVERPEVFAATHGLVCELFSAGTIDGVRVDHIDGLADPGTFCRRLRRALGGERAPRRAYIVVEKILAPGESLPPDWQVDGTTGYDFMSEVGGLLHDPAGEAPLLRLWTRLAGEDGGFAVAHRARAELAGRVFSAEMGRAVRALVRAMEGKLGACDFPPLAVARVVAALAAHFPVYRQYPGRRGAAEAVFLERAVAAAGCSLGRADRPFLERLFEMLAEAPEGARSGAVGARRRHLQARQPWRTFALHDGGRHRIAARPPPGSALAVATRDEAAAPANVGRAPPWPGRQTPAKGSGGRPDGPPPTGARQCRKLSSPVSPDRMAPISPNSCSARAIACSACCAAPPPPT
ncbi:MAG: hypothetical protein ACREFP_24450 [Acetobacteraceae bacterium]